MAAQVFRFFLGPLTGRRKRPGGAIRGLDAQLPRWTRITETSEERGWPNLAVSRRLVENPVVCDVGDFHDQWKIIATETGGILPLISVLVDSTDCHIVTHAVFRGVFPHRGFDASETNFMNGTLAGSVFLGHGIAFQKQTDNRTN